MNVAFGILEMASISLMPQTPYQAVRNHLPNQNSIMTPKPPRPTRKEIHYRSGHNPLNPKHTKHHPPHIRSHRAMDKQVIHTLPIAFTQTAPILEDQTTLPQIINSKSLPQRSNPREKSNSGGETLAIQIIFQGNKMEVIGVKD